MPTNIVEKTSITKRYKKLLAIVKQMIGIQRDLPTLYAGLLMMSVYVCKVK